MIKTISFATASLLLAAATASAASVTPTKTNGDFIGGSGIPSDNFTVANGSDGEQVALKARDRDTGQPISQSGSDYYVPIGTNGANPAWSFDFQFKPADGVTQYFLTLQVDFDPSAATSYRTINAPIFGGWDSFASDGFFVNGAPLFSDPNTPYVYSQSWHLGFGFWSLVSPGGPTGYNPNAPGIYTINLIAHDGGTSPVIYAQTSINAIVDPGVVPTPAAATAGLTLLSALSLRRRPR